MGNNDPLTKLVSSGAEEGDKQKLADLLEPFIVFDSNSHKMNFKDNFFKLATNVDKLEIILLAEKARSLIFKEEGAEGLTSSQIIEIQIMPEGSVKATIKTLFDSKKILKNNQGYYTPNFRLNELFSKFKGNS